MPRHCLALDLKNDPTLIDEYDAHHREVWPEVLESIRNAGILDMEIYRSGNRLFMIMEVTEEFDADAKAKADAANSVVRKWEALMWKFQKPLPWANEGEKWINMHKIFSLRE